jgi:hypothetical protein
MKKITSLLLANFFITSLVWGGMPQFPSDKIDRLETLSETEQAEAGAFMLFYDLVSQGKIGGDSGLCLSYEAGDAGGTPDKISIGLDSKSYPTGIASIDQVPKEKLQNLKLLMKQIGRYLDSGCAPGKEAECRAGRNVSITGYADAQHYGSPGSNSDKVETSIMKNVSLAQNRAQLFSKVIDGEGFVNPDQVKAYGKASPIGEYLQEGLPIPPQYNPQGKIFSASKYKKDCPERRVTVIDVEFNSKKMETSSSKGVISPSVKSASANFVKMASLGATVQTHKAAQSLGMNKIKNDKEADKLIDKIMDMNGITNSEMRNACKNMQTRTMVREHLDQINSAPESVRTTMGSKSESEIMRLARLPKKYKDEEYSSNLDLINYYNGMNAGFGGVENLSKYPLLTTSGQSTTLNDCFSAKAAMQAEFTKNPSLRNEVCKPVNDYKNPSDDHVDIMFHPKELEEGHTLHIGCQACKTGFRYVPKKYTNPESGKEETQMVPVFVDREANIRNKENPELNTYRPIEPTEAADISATANNMEKLASDLYVKATAEVSSTKDRTIKLELVKYKQFLSNLKGLSNGNTGYINRTVKSAPGNPEPDFQMSDTESPYLKSMLEKAGISASDYQKTVRLNQILSNPIYGNVEKEYLTAKMMGYDNQETKRYEQVILPGIKARDILTNWDGKGTGKDSNNMLFGSLKKPRYYLLDDCSCDSPDLIEQAVTKGKAVTIDSIPYDRAKQKVGKNTCLISIPVPPSCMVSPSEAGLAGKDDNPAESRIKWMGLNGENMDKAISEMKTHFSSQNAKVKVTGCEGLPPLAVAQRIVDSAECSGENAIPQAEELDCRK